MTPLAPFTKSPTLTPLPESVKRDTVNQPAFGWAKEEPSPGRQGEGQGRGEEPGSAAPKNLPAYGARNAQTVAAGTGEALPGPAACGRSAVGAARPITGDEPGSGWRAGRESETAVVPLEPTGQQNPR